MRLEDYTPSAPYTTKWEALQLGGATRHSLLINLGGGMVTDLGGFAASTFKRGINFINIPTTLLAMVDASVGGKTGVNFGGLKNEIGVFSEADVVLLNTEWLKTLDTANIRSGYAEMLKHGLIADEAMWAEPEATIAEIIEKHGLQQMTDTGAIEAMVDEVLANNAKAVEQFKSGNEKALNAIVGQVMKASKGKANPAQVQELIKAKLA